MLGEKIMLKKDHSSLSSYFKHADLNLRHARWNDFISEFDMDTQHVKGKENQVADALSRKLHCVYELYYNHLESKFLN